MDDRRGAQRIVIPKPVPATFGGFAVTMIEISLIGCSVEHTDRIAPKSKLPLKFKWRGSEVRLEATVIRSEMRPVGKKLGYRSGVEFCRTPEESPAVIKEIVGWLTKQAAPKEAPAVAPPPPPAPEPEPVEEAEEIEEIGEDAEILSADYLQCVFRGGKWLKLYVESPAQPRDGFTIVAPANDAEADVLCRAWEKADTEKRKAMRARFEAAIKQQQRA